MWVAQRSSRSPPPTQCMMRVIVVAHTRYRACTHLECVRRAKRLKGSTTSPQGVGPTIDQRALTRPHSVAGRLLSLSRITGIIIASSSLPRAAALIPSTRLPACLYLERRLRGRFTKDRRRFAAPAKCGDQTH